MLVGAVSIVADRQRAPAGGRGLPQWANQS
jgi:hypothetical protein